ncbi:MAG: hypothetical protein AAGI49_08700 [Bacteroidota bacterium]
MKYVTGKFDYLESQPNYYDNYRNRIPVVVSTENRIREHIKDWLRDEGFHNGFIDLTLWSYQKTPGSYQAQWVDGKIDAKYWKDKTWQEIWKAMLEGFEQNKRSEAHKYFILLFTPAATWTAASESNKDRHVLFENRNVHNTFTEKNGWEPSKQIIIWKTDAIFYE